jgi:hypothetical protein
MSALLEMASTYTFDSHMNYALSCCCTVRIFALQFILSDDVAGQSRCYIRAKQASQMPMEDFYQIRVRGYLDVEWSDWFDRMTIAHEADGITALTGAVVDQAALYGVLIRLRNLGLPLLSVNIIEHSNPRSG